MLQTLVLSDDPKTPTIKKHKNPKPINHYTHTHTHTQNTGNHIFLKIYKHMLQNSCDAPKLPPNSNSQNTQVNVCVC